MLPLSAMIQRCGVRRTSALCPCGVWSTEATNNADRRTLRERIIVQGFERKVMHANAGRKFANNVQDRESKPDPEVRRNTTPFIPPKHFSLRLSCSPYATASCTCLKFLLQVQVPGSVGNLIWSSPSRRLPGGLGSRTPRLPSDS